MPNHTPAPSFVETKNWVRDTAREIGAPISVRHAKALARVLVMIADRRPDETDDHLSIVYSDPVGEKIAARWMHLIAAERSPA